MKRIVMKNARNFNYVKRDKEYGTVEGHDSEKKEWMEDVAWKVKWKKKKKKKGESGCRSAGVLNIFPVK